MHCFATWSSIIFGLLQANDVELVGNILSGPFDLVEFMMHLSIKIEEHRKQNLVIMDVAIDQSYIKNTTN